MRQDQILGLSENDLSQIGFGEIMSSLPFKSPFGRTLAYESTCYGRDKVVRLQHYFRSLQSLSDMYQKDDLVFARIIMELAHLREVRGSLTRLVDEDVVLDTVEFFELKRFLTAAAKIATEQAVLGVANITIKPFAQLQASLDPDNTGVMSFYIYDSYDAELAELRRRKRSVEQEILGEITAVQRQELIEQRQALATQADELEYNVRKRLTSSFAPFAPELTALARALGELDLMLAKVVFAKSYHLVWPVINPKALGLQQENGWLPQLVATGVRIVRQSIELESGSTVLTGANMGGKSVGLKTVVLNALLAQVGMPVFAEGFSTPCFDGIVYSADITAQMGAKLSSFGAEVMRLREAVTLPLAERWLIVLDEPARGTNPQEAEAIVCGVCNWFKSKSHYLLLATHYNVSRENLTARYQVRGLSRNSIPECDSDNKRLSALAAAMDYRIMRLESDEPPPHEAFCICEWLGLPETVMNLINQQWEKKYGDTEY